MWLQIEDSYNPILGFDNLLECLTELRKALHLLFLIYYKGHKSNGRDSWGRILGESDGEVQSLQVLFGDATLLAL